MSTRWLTTDVLKQYVRSQLVVDDGFYEQAIQSAENWLDERTQRRWVVASGSSARSFNPSGSRVLFINDCTTITSVVDNGSTLVSGIDYQKEPLNGLSDTGEVVPYYRLVRLGGVEWYEITEGLASVVITAAWGWLAIPPMILEACKIVAKDYFLQRDVNHGLVDISDVGGVGSRENRLVQAAVERYAHPNVIGVA